MLVLPGIDSFYFITHDVDLALWRSDQMIIIDDSRVIADGIPVGNRARRIIVAQRKCVTRPIGAARERLCTRRATEHHTAQTRSAAPRTCSPTRPAAIAVRNRSVPELRPKILRG